MLLIWINRLSIEFDRFLKAVSKAYEYCKYQQQKNQPPLPDPIDYLFAKAAYELVKIDIGKIRYIEGLKDYIKIYTDADKFVLTHSILKQIQEKLPLRSCPHSLCKVHRINPVTKTNWEGVGAVPDIKVAAQDAFITAHQAALAICLS